LTSGSAAAAILDLTSTGAKKDRRTASDILIANLTNDAAALSLIRFADKP
jgi:hypothetical protein